MHTRIAGLLLFATASAASAAEAPKPYHLPDDTFSQYTSVPHIKGDGSVEYIDFIYNDHLRGIVCRDNADGKFMVCDVVQDGQLIQWPFRIKE